ncbi:MAG: hypothetical protein DMF89_07395 [Acidobacteria bacterium]|nr:MAG: hypothetical protein DMF89_07395 [Acidobacteriota bacterium]
MKVVEQPLARGGNWLASVDVIGDLPIDSSQKTRLLVESAKMNHAPAPPCWFRDDTAIVRQ